MSSTFLGYVIFSEVRLFYFLHVLSAFSGVKSKIFNNLYLLASAFQPSSIGRDLKGSRGVDDIYTNSHESICVSSRSKHTRGRCTDNISLSTPLCSTPGCSCFVVMATKVILASEISVKITNLAFFDQQSYAKQLVVFSPGSIKMLRLKFQYPLFDPVLYSTENVFT